MKQKQVHPPLQQYSTEAVVKLPPTLNNIERGGVIPEPKETIDGPAYYGGKDNIYEAIKIIEHYKLGFCLGNTLKYILRAGKKNPAKELEDLRKAAWYINREIQTRENELKRGSN